MSSKVQVILSAAQMSNVYSSPGQNHDSCKECGYRHRPDALLLSALKTESEAKSLAKAKGDCPSCREQV